MKKLTTEEIQERLEGMDSWWHEDDSINISIDFKDFREAISAIVAIAFEAEVQQHHPTLINTYNHLTISLSTHDAKGVTEKDFALARHIDKMLTVPE